MKTKSSLVFCLLTLFTLAGCKKNKDVSPTVKPIDVGIVAYGATSLGPTIWKNGVTTTLLGLPNSKFAETTGWAVTGSDVYTSGYTTSSMLDYNFTPVYWKNGTITTLATNSKDSVSTNGIAISGSDIYIAGNLHTNLAAIYWKDNVMIKLDDGINSKISQSFGIAVDGTDVYVFGQILKNGGHYQACLWKNGVLTEITDGLNDAYPASMAVQNNNVYIIYTQYQKVNGLDVAVGYYWKNGISTQLLGNPAFNIPLNITLIGGDVYITGYSAAGSITAATVWKNNVIQTLPSTTSGIAQGVTVSGNDIYVSGSIFGEGAVYWKNGVAVKLSTDPNSAADGIGYIGN